MKPAIRALLDDSRPGGDRRSFCKRLGIRAGAAIAMTGEGVKQHLRPNSGLFLPTPEWDSVLSDDRPWS